MNAKLTYLTEAELQDSLASEFQQIENYLYHRGLWDWIFVLQMLQPEMEVPISLSKLKKNMLFIKDSSGSHVSATEAMVNWKSQLDWSKVLTLARAEHNLAGGYLVLPPGKDRVHLTLDMDAYYAFTGLILLGIKPADVATAMIVEPAELRRMLKRAIDKLIFYKDRI